MPAGEGWREIALLTVYGGAAGLLYGALMNLWMWPFVTGLDSEISFQAERRSGKPRSVHRLHAGDLAGFDIPRAITNAVLIAIGRPVLLALRRVARRAAFEAPVDFAPTSTATPTSKSIMH